jgi:hypothetical protein
MSEKSQTMKAIPFAFSEKAKGMPICCLGPIFAENGNPAEAILKNAKTPELAQPAGFAGP